MVTAPPRRQPPETRREQVLDAARRELLRRGLPNTTIADIAEAAGLGKGTVYLYFESKAALLAGLREHYVQQLEQVVRGRVATAGSPQERVAALVHGLIDAGTKEQALHHLLFQEAGFDEADAFAPIRRLFQEVICRGDFDLPDPALAADFVLGGAHASLMMAAHAPAARRRRITAAAAELAMRTVGRATPSSAVSASRRGGKQQ